MKSVALFQGRILSCVTVAAFVFGVGNPAALAMPVQAGGDNGATAGVNINTVGKVMHITAQSENNFIKWLDFSLNANEKILFDEKNFLNYVCGEKRSVIDGIICGGGDIYIINPNGIIFGTNARVDVGSLHLSGRGLTDDALSAFENGQSPLTFRIDGTLTGDVINMGTLRADVIQIEGKDIVFSNADRINSDVTIKAYAAGSIHVGQAMSDIPLAAEDYTYYGNVLPPLGRFEFNKTPNRYALVRNYFELQSISGKLSGNYMLDGDITDAENLPSLNGGAGFLPIGSHDVITGAILNSPNVFGGKFYGMGHAIKNLTIDNNAAPYVGLFALLDNDAAVRDLTLTGGAIHSACAALGNIDNTLYIGALAGWNKGKILGVTNDNSVSAEPAANIKANVGGLVGNFGGGSISESRNLAAVTAETAGKTYVGGIAGRINASNANLQEVYNSGQIFAKSTAENNVGGLVGGIYGKSLANCITHGLNFATVTAEGTSGNAGGIVGIVNGERANTPVKLTLTDCLNFEVTNGGIVGKIYKGEITDGSSAYFLQTDGTDNASFGVGKSLDELKTLATTLLGDGTWQTGADNLPQLARISQMSALAAAQPPQVEEETSNASDNAGTTAGNAETIADNRQMNPPQTKKANAAPPTDTTVPQKSSVVGPKAKPQMQTTDNTIDKNDANVTNAKANDEDFPAGSVAVGSGEETTVPPNEDKGHTANAETAVTEILPIIRAVENETNKDPATETDFDDVALLPTDDSDEEHPIIKEQ